MEPMKGLRIKLEGATLRRLRLEARETGLSVAALVRERLQAPKGGAGSSVYGLTADLAGSLAGSGKPATNARHRFRRS